MPSKRYKIPKISETATLNIAADKTAQFDYNFNHTGGDISVIGNGFGYSFFMPASSCTLASQQLAETFTGLKTLSFPSLATTSTDGLFITNATAATSGVPVQMSPRLRFRGNGWDTTSSVSRTTDWIIENLPISGTTVSSQLRFGHSLAGGSYTYPIQFASTGSILIPGEAVIQNKDSSDRGYLQIGSLNTGNKIYRNINDAYTALTIDNHQGTGNILNLQFGGSNKAYVDKDGNVNASGKIQAGGYKSSDGTEGMTNTITFTDKDSKVNTITIKNGLITAWTQA